MLTNMDKLYESVAANGPVCVGLDTEIGYLPTTDTAKTAGENVLDFNRALIAATKGVAGCYKVQIAYYESLGLDGMRAYAETLKLARATGLPVIADIKRGDIAKTAEMYAKVKALSPWGIASWAPSIVSRVESDGKTYAGEPVHPRIRPLQGSFRPGCRDR